MKNNNDYGSINSRRRATPKQLKNIVTACSKASNLPKGGTWTIVWHALKAIWNGKNDVYFKGFSKAHTNGEAYIVPVGKSVTHGDATKAMDAYKAGNQYKIPARFLKAIKAEIAERAEA